MCKPCYFFCVLPDVTLHAFGLHLVCRLLLTVCTAVRILSVTQYETYCVCWVQRCPCGSAGLSIYPLSSTVSCLNPSLHSICGCHCCNLIAWLLFVLSSSSLHVAGSIILVQDAWQMRALDFALMCMGEANSAICPQLMAWCFTYSIMEQLSMSARVQVRLCGHLFFSC